MMQSLFERFDNIEDVTSQHWAWVTMQANAEGVNPVMKKAGIKAAFARRVNKRGKRKK